MYTADDARREVKECLQEGYGFDYIRIFLNDLKRGGDITKDEWNTIFFELVDGKLGKVNCSYGTY